MTRSITWPTVLMLAIIGSGDYPLQAAEPANEKAPAPKPLLKDFIGVCGHTVNFKPKLYYPAARLVRDYHPFDWDVGDDTSRDTTFPLARNKVDWNAIYGLWREQGFDVEVSIMFDNLKPESWKDPAADSFKYGKAFATTLGPSAKKPLVAAAEIGNEPGKYDDKLYRTVFENMARGLREGDPKMQIVTCAAVPGKSHAYAKSLECLRGLEKLYDAINVHTYAQVEGWPTWRRSYPEDPTIPYLKDVEQTIAWRNAHAPGKPIWITEFGWDASMKLPPKTGDFAKWQGSTETEQARYLVRSFFVFARMDVARAYIYFFNDKDEAQVHGASGLTRDFVPKPAYHAVSHLQKTLGDYRFARVVREKPGELAVFEFTHGTEPGKRIWAVWSPTGSDRVATAKLPLEGGKIVKAEGMPLVAGKTPPVGFDVQEKEVLVPVTESPIYLWLDFPAAE